MEPRELLLQDIRKPHKLKHVKQGKLVGKLQDIHKPHKLKHVKQGKLSGKLQDIHKPHKLKHVKQGKLVGSQTTQVKICKTRQASW